MSLIQEALEKSGKARAEMEAGKVHKIPFQNRMVTITRVLKRIPTFVPVAAKPESEIRKRGLAIALVVLVLAGGSLFSVRLNPSSNVLQVSEHTLSPVAAPVQSVVKPAAIRMPSFMPRPAAVPVFRLSGITSSNGMPLALINNQIVGVGDRLKENARVKAITSRTVTLIYKEETLKLSL